MTDEELCKELRDGDHFEKVMCAKTAADRIEALVKERDAVIEARDMMGRLWAKEKARAEAAEAALKEAVSRMRDIEVGSVCSVSRATARAFLAKHGSQK